jgi:hypothetical protein
MFYLKWRHKFESSVLHVHRLILVNIGEVTEEDLENRDDEDEIAGGDGEDLSEDQPIIFEKDIIWGTELVHEGMQFPDICGRSIVGCM